MVIKIRTKIARGANGYIIRVPKTYIDDGNLTLGVEYEATISPATAPVKGRMDPPGFGLPSSPFTYPWAVSLRQAEICS